MRAPSSCKSVCCHELYQNAEYIRLKCELLYFTMKQQLQHQHQNNYTYTRARTHALALAPIYSYMLDILNCMGKTIDSILLNLMETFLRAKESVNEFYLWSHVTINGSKMYIFCICRLEFDWFDLSSPPQRVFTQFMHTMNYKVYICL